MIRRKVSTGVLRATKSTGSLRATALAQSPASVSTQQTAGLASATLLSSQRNWGRETVVTLKGELKKRGLSQAGTKAVLIERLKSADTSAFLPPMPNIPSSRNLSTSTTSLAKKSQSKEAEASEPKTEVPIVSSGPEVVSQQTEAPPKIEPTPAEVSIAPGLPATKGKEGKKSPLQVSIPQPDEDKEVPANIPVEPDNFRAPEPTPEPKPQTPKVVTVASAATHIAGGPTHALHEAVDPTTLEETEEKVKEGVESLSSVISSALSAPGKAIKSSEITSSLPTIGSAKGFEDGKKEYKANTKKLDGEEKKGLWILGGIVSFGLLLGGGKKEKTSHKEHASHASSEHKGVKGDAAWEKASGAGIVGHGARKD